MARVMIGSKVKHTAFGEIGKVTGYRRDPMKYNYRVIFDANNGTTYEDWFRRDVLELLS